jgi:dTDP-N-acetylfucosamine:lipid II N-acetylfucosaminyltransferase
MSVIHHLMPSSPYSARFVQLLEDHPDAFPPGEHHLWIKRTPRAAFRVADRGRIARTDTGAWGFLRVFGAMRGGDRLVVHQLSNPRLLLFLATVPGAARRCGWAVWGGDVYHYLWRAGAWRYPFDEFLRRRVLPAIPVVSSMVPGDFDVVRSVYGSRARYVCAFYPIPMDHAILHPDGARPRRADGPVVLVGNSGDPSNRHAWVFEALARFRDAGIRVMAPLAYGNPAYVAGVIARGRELFGERFEPLTDFLPPEQYAARIREVDAAIMNHGYQQALGNIIALLLLGRKVYVRSDTTPYRYFNDLGAPVYDTLRLPDLTLEELVAFDPAAGARGAERVREHLSEPNAVAGWSAFFDAVRGRA